MTAAAQNDNDAARNAQKRKVSLTILRSFAFVLANGRTYGFQHKVTQEAMAHVAQALNTYQRVFGELVFSIHEGKLVLLGKTVARPPASLEDFIKQLSDLGVSSLSFGVGLTPAELVRWFQIIISGMRPGHGGFGALLSSSGLSHISTDKYRYQQVSEDEIVAKKGQVESIGRQRNATPLKTARRLLDSTPPGQALPPLGIRVEDEEIFGDLVQLAMPPQESDAHGAVSLADEAVDRMERLSGGLLAHPMNRTQNGRRTLRKLLKAVEEKMSERLQKLGADIDAVERLASKVKELVENLAVDGIVAKYVKLRGELVGTEAKLTRRIRRSKKKEGKTGPEKIGERLLDAGLPKEVLQDLLETAERSSKGKGKGKGAGNGTGTGTGTGGGDGSGSSDDKSSAAESTAPTEDKEKSKSPLTSLLARLRETPPGSGDLSSLVGDILTEMNKSLLKTQERAKEQLETLKRKIAIPFDKPEGDRMSRKELFRMLSELGQELKQPLTVVVGAAQMLSSDYFGVVSEEQKMAINLISESATELDTLIGHFISIVGLPASLKPGPLAYSEPLN